MYTRSRKELLLSIGCLSLFATSQAVLGQDEPETHIDEIVMYAIESSSPGNLMRYFFGTDTYVPIGEVWTADGIAVDDIEALSWVGRGPYKGLYGVATDGATEQHLTRISPLTAEAVVYGPNLGGEKITGMISDYDPVTDTSWLLATDAGGKLRLINIEDGNATTLCNIGEDIEGLARNSEGVIYGITNEELFRLEPTAGFGQYNTVLVGSIGLDKAESLEFAMGDAQPPIDIPGVDPTWVEHGALFVFDDDTNRFGILNPNTAEFVEYTINGIPSTFANQDAEGMVFVTSLSDPLYGSIDGFD